MNKYLSEDISRSLHEHKLREVKEEHMYNPRLLIGANNFFVEAFKYSKAMKGKCKDCGTEVEFMVDRKYMRLQMVSGDCRFFRHVKCVECCMPEKEEGLWSKMVSIFHGYFV